MKGSHTENQVTSEEHENELRDLKRKFSVYSHNAWQIRKDAEHIRLEKMAKLLCIEQKDLSHFLDVSKHGLHGVRAQQVKTVMFRQITQTDYLALKTSRENEKIKDVEMAIDLLRNQVFKLTAIANVLLNTEERQGRSACHLKNMENTLDTGLKRFSSINAQNEAIRNEISLLLKERAVFTKIWNGMIARLEKGKVHMKTIVGQLEDVSSQREELVEKLQSLNQQGHRDLVLGTLDMQHHKNNLDEIYKLYEFVRVKNSRRLTDEEQLQQKLNEEVERAREEELKYREKKLNEIFDFTGKNMVSQVIVNFKRKESYNLSLFKYVCEVQSDCFVLAAEIHKLAPQIMQATHTLEDRRMRNAQRVLSLLEQIHQQQELNNCIKHQIHNCDRLVSIIFQDIHDLFETCAISMAPLLRLLGRQRSVTQHNYLWYINAIANFVNKHLQLAYMNQAHERARKQLFADPSKHISRTDSGGKSVDRPLSEKPLSPVSAKLTSFRESAGDAQAKMTKEEMTVVHKGNDGDRRDKEKAKQLKKKRLDFTISLPYCKPFLPVDITEIVSYTPCAYCQEDWVFQQVSEEPVRPMTRREVKATLTTPPFNTPYGVNTKTDVTVVHTTQMIKMAERKAKENHE